MIKPTSIRNVQGAFSSKCFAHKDEITIVVSETDSVYLYSGGSGKSLRMLAFNPKTEQAIYLDEKWETHNCFTEELKRFVGAREVYAKGLQLLAAASYSLAESEQKKIREWVQSLLKRTPIDREELMAGHCLVAIDSQPNPIHMGCRMLGDRIDRSDRSILFFKVQKDPDLAYGIWVSEQDNQKIYIGSSALTQCGVSANSSISVRLTREEAKWLRGLLLPYPAQRYLNIHKAMLEADESKIKQRGKAILRGVSRAGGFGNVAI